MEEKDRNAVLHFDNVSLSFGDEKALDGVSLALYEGQTAIIFGSAGSGKSVLLKTAIGLLQPDSGHVYLFGQEVSGLSEDELFPLRAKAGILFQESGLFDSLNIEDNVGYPLLNLAKSVPPDDEVSRRVTDALRFVELEHTLEKFPSELSGGMRRRVGIARATVSEPQLMLYDSPTAGLDPITANTIIALIVKARDTKKTTSAVVTHRYQDGHILANFGYNPQNGQLQAAGRDVHENTLFLVFRQGRLEFEGTQEELEAATDPYLAKFKSSR
ncbi:MAG: ATP-binding cassette domain-containing protein [Bryobacteraceae bacterium]